MPEVWVQYGPDAAGDDAWLVFSDGVRTSAHTTKKAAVRTAKTEARKLVRRDGYAELQVETKKGGIQYRKTFGRDEQDALFNDASFGDPDDFDLPGLN